MMRMNSIIQCNVKFITACHEANIGKVSIIIILIKAYEKSSLWLNLVDLKDIERIININKLLEINQIRFQADTCR